MRHFLGGLEEISASVRVRELAHDSRVEDWMSVEDFPVFKDPGYVE